MELTKAEEVIMQVLWKKKECMVREVRETFADPKPSRNTVSTVIRILEIKGFVGHKGEGKTYTYFPLVSRHEYSYKQLSSLLNNYFNNSFPQMAIFFAEKNDLTMEELDEIMNQTKNTLKTQKETHE